MTLQWEWTDGTALGEYNNWAPNEPSHRSGTECAYYSYKHEWDDTPCTKTKQSLCEKDGELMGGNNQSKKQVLPERVRFHK